MGGGSSKSDIGPKDFHGDVEEEAGGFHVLFVVVLYFIVWYEYLAWGTLFV